MTTSVSDANGYFKNEIDRWGKMVPRSGFRTALLPDAGRKGGSAHRRGQTAEA